MRLLVHADGDVYKQEAQLKQGLADRTAKTAVSVAVEAKPEVEIWRRSKKSTF